MRVTETAVVSAWADSARWDLEYGSIRAIPSSHRLTPSHTFRRLAPLMHLPGGARVLDAGAGTGRHSLYLAAHGCDVHAIDASEVACEVLRERAASASCPGSIFVEQAVLDFRDVPDEKYDLIVDSYVSCHLLDEDQRLRYLESLLTKLRPGGYLYTACMGAGDSYYLEHRLNPTGPLATDPLNGVTKRLQSRTSFNASVAELTRGATTVAERFVDVVDGVVHSREVVAALLPRS